MTHTITEEIAVDAARFATRRDGVEEVRTHVVRVAVAHLVAGRRAEALDVMLEGLALQAPLTFRSRPRPETRDHEEPA